MEQERLKNELTLLNMLQEEEKLGFDCVYYVEDAKIYFSVVNLYNSNPDEFMKQWNGKPEEEAERVLERFEMPIQVVLPEGKTIGDYKERITNYKY